MRQWFWVYNGLNQQTSIYMEPIKQDQEFFVTQNLIKNQGVACKPRPLHVRNVFIRGSGDNRTDYKVANNLGEVVDVIGVKEPSSNKLFKWSTDLVSGQLDLTNAVAVNYGDQVYLSAEWRFNQKNSWIAKTMRLVKNTICRTKDTPITTCFTMPAKIFGFLFQPINGEFPLALAPDQRVDTLINSIRTEQDSQRRSFQFTALDTLISETPSAIAQRHVDALVVLITTDQNPDIRQRAFASAGIAEMMRPDLLVPRTALPACSALPRPALETSRSGVHALLS